MPVSAAATTTIAARTARPRDRMPWRWNNATSGSSATARKMAISSQMMIWRVSHRR